MCILLRIFFVSVLFLQGNGTVFGMMKKNIEIKKEQSIGSDFIGLLEQKSNKKEIKKCVIHFDLDSIVMHDPNEWKSVEQHVLYLLAKKTCAKWEPNVEFTSYYDFVMKKFPKSSNKLDGNSEERNMLFSIFFDRLKEMNFKRYEETKDLFDILVKNIKESEKKHYIAPAFWKFIKNMNKNFYRKYNIIIHSLLFIHFGHIQNLKK